MSNTAAIHADGVRRSFGDVLALDGLDLEVATGTVSGLLRPDGAGKTTLIRVLATLLRPTEGRASVLGHDVIDEPLAVRRRIGLAGQFAAVDGELTGRENLEMIGRRAATSGHDGAADHAVPRGGRPPRTANRSGRPRAHRGRGHRGRARGHAGDEGARRAARGRGSQRRRGRGAHGNRRRGPPLVDRATGELRVSVYHSNASAEAVRRLDAQGLALASVELQEPSLDDVFLALTGRRPDAEPARHETAREAA
jgi:ABC-type sugar transport system ATPase subunit